MTELYGLSNNFFFKILYIDFQQDLMHVTKIYRNIFSDDKIKTMNNVQQFIK